ncbi:MAG: hypothetical protein JRH20_32445, partial [Deltaproteobacteria bacterium]|nr:hypothetical protein [Deltaproteobacteria bacterium]
WRMARKVEQHPGVALDILRRYVMVYQWLPGIDAWEAYRQGLIGEQDAFALMTHAARELAEIGYRVLDSKPQHVILDPEKLAVHGSGHLEDIDYGLVDYELLERTHEHQLALTCRRHEAYDRQQRVLLGAADLASDAELPDYLTSHEVFGVPYLMGRTESTGGKLWVVGHEPDAFDLFLPERWRTTPQIRLWENHESFLTTSKDNLRLVWKVSRVGERPATAAFGGEAFRVLAHGFNSPFEEVGMALWLLQHGISTILPRAIYQTGHRAQLDDSLFDPSRYRSHEGICSADGEPVLERRRNYISLWDCCGVRAFSKGEPRPVMRSLNCDEARLMGLLSSAETQEVLSDLAERMLAVGIEPLRFLPSHVLVLQGSAGVGFWGRR